jgi:hypothetical protein
MPGRVDGYEGLVAATFTARGVQASEEEVRDVAQLCGLEHEVAPFNSALDVADWSVYAHGFSQDAAEEVESSATKAMEGCPQAPRLVDFAGDFEGQAIALDLET